ncbi:MAG: glutathione-disulfide reductase [Betaproteobacteria bacterium]|nr:glutathione-disulfide reductase [Betaproteobacteria bacterium]
MPQYDFDLFTIGAGSGGVRASRVSAGYGARVAVAEEARLGGTCVNVGCIPKKLFSYAAHFREDFHDAAGFGWSLPEPSFDWPTLLANKDREIARLNGIYGRLLANAGATLIEHRATLVDAHTVECGGRRYTAEHILVATGSWPVLPEIPGRELAITSNEAFHLERLPTSIIIVGGGYIAVEFASIFNGLGVDTTLVYRGPRLLRSFDAELGTRLAAEMLAKGVKIRFEADIAALTRDPSGALAASFRDGSAGTAGAVMFATGRLPNTRGIGLEAAGVQLTRDGAILVNDYLQSSVPSIHALGDVTHRNNLTPVATAEGMALAKTLFRSTPTRIDYQNIPTAVFSIPNVATVGLSEQEARQRHRRIDIYKTGFRALKHTLTGNEEKTFMKLVVNAENERVLGAHMIGPDAGEVIQGIAIALKCGATKPQFDATIGIHPTAAEEFVTLREKST